MFITGCGLSPRGTEAEPEEAEREASLVCSLGLLNFLACVSQARLPSMTLHSWLTLPTYLSNQDRHIGQPEGDSFRIEGPSSKVCVNLQKLTSSGTGEAARWL